MEQQFRLGSANDPKSVISQLLSVERQTGRTPAELQNLVECPSELLYLWDWFLQLNNKRQSGMSINSISWSDTDAFFRLIDIQPTQEELNILSKLDNIALKHFSEQQKEEQKKSSAKTKTK